MGIMRRLPGFKKPVEVDENSGLTRLVQGFEPEKANGNNTFKANRASGANQSPHTDSHAHVCVCECLARTGGENNLEYPVCPEWTSNGAGLPIQGSDSSPVCPECSPPHPDPADWRGEYGPADSRNVLYRPFGDPVMWPHRPASVPGHITELGKAAEFLDDEGLGPVAVIQWSTP